MRLHGWMGLLALGFVLSLAGDALGFAQSAPSTSAQKAIGILPVTTSSAKGRRQFEQSMLDLENVREAEALQNLRAAIQSDPNFTQALILLSHLSSDPEEQLRARTRARTLMARVTRGERLLVRWLAGAQEGNYLPAIAAMNDLMASYPQDHRVAFLAGRWLVHKERYTLATTVLERAIRLAPDYPAVLNQLGYAYAFNGNFPKAFSAMERYVALQPDQPNPHDSYGEILRMAGKFDDALKQYRASIQIDPNFGSELGVADTYTVMGKQAEARDEYERAIVFAGVPGTKVAYELQSAVTWIRENNLKQATRALNNVAKHAHQQGLAFWEAESYRVLAACDPDYKNAGKWVQSGLNALQEAHPLSPSDREEEHARLLRIQAIRAAQAGDRDTAGTAVEQLQTMSASSQSQVVQLAAHSAQGALLLAEQQYPEAIAQLEEDASDPLSMRLLWQAYSRAGHTEKATALGEKLAAWYIPTADQALVVPQFHTQFVSENQKHP